MINLPFDCGSQAITAPGVIYPTASMDPKSLLSFFGRPLSDYRGDGFKYVCKIKNNSTKYEWNYENIDTSVMFKHHRSWVYLIAVDDIVFKIGETANPLGIRTSCTSIQPKTGSTSRLGRYRKGDATDEDIRINAFSYLAAGCKIEFWAKECEIVKSTTMLCGAPVEVEGSTQKSQEMAYIHNFISVMGCLPKWNKYKK